MRKISRRTIEETVRRVLARVLQLDQAVVTMDANIEQDLDADSLDAVEIMMELEKEFGITVEDDEMDWLNQKTVREVCDYVEEVRKAHEKD